jgi:hypothetical protein
MCRSIQTLRPPYTDEVTPDDVRAAALQYVRKISGMRAPAAHNREVFDGARMPEILRTYCSAAACMSSEVTCSTNGGRRVWILRHMGNPLRLLGV